MPYTEGLGKLIRDENPQSGPNRDKEKYYKKLAEKPALGESLQTSIDRAAKKIREVYDNLDKSKFYS